MPGNIHEQIAAGMRAEQFAINEMGNPGEGMPVGDFNIREGPDYVVPG